MITRGVSAGVSGKPGDEKSAVARAKKSFNFNDLHPGIQGDLTIDGRVGVG
jgi:hypothetical protein